MKTLEYGSMFMIQ